MAGAAGELGELDVARGRVEHVGLADGGLRDLGPRHRHGQGLRQAAADDRDLDLRPLGPLELAHGVVEVHLIGRLAFDGADDVTRLDAEPGGRGPFERGDDGELPVADAHQDAQTVEAGLLLLPHPLVSLGAEEGGVRVEGAEHAVDRGVDDVPVGDVRPIPVVRHVHQLGVQAQRITGLVGDGQEPVAQQPAEHQHEKEQSDRCNAP